jgi:hypothetical protein
MAATLPPPQSHQTIAPPHRISSITFTKSPNQSIHRAPAIYHSHSTTIITFAELHHGQSQPLPVHNQITQSAIQFHRDLHSIKSISPCQTCKKTLQTQSTHTLCQFTKSSITNSQKTRALNQICKPIRRVLNLLHTPP